MKVDLSGLDRLTDKLKKIENLDPTLLLENWRIIMEDDNRQGVLKGLDKDGNSMTPVTYRPKSTPHQPTLVQKNGAGRVGRFGGFGPMNAGLHNNLTTKEYEKLGGPPLAPRGVFSRVITNFKTSIVEMSSNSWAVVGGWAEVVNSKGKSFLGAHFNGKGVPKRDLRGVRPEGMAEARQSFIAWARDAIRWG